LFLRLFVLAAVGFFASIGLTGCVGGGGTAPVTAVAGSASNLPTASAQTSAQSVEASVGAAPATAALPLTGGLSGSITLHSATSNATLTIGADGSANAGRAMPLWHGACNAVPPIVISNHSSQPITISIDGFSIHLKCSVDGLLFGASAYQSYPIPQTLVSTKLGDAKGSGHTLTFTPVVTQLTIPAKSALTISILPEASTAYAQLPAFANTATVLTSNAPAVRNSLAFAFPNVQGGATFQSACYLPNGGPGLAGVHVLGTASFYCVLVPGQAGASTTFGGASSGDVVKFTLGPNAKPDLSLVGLDGPPIFAGCTPNGSGQVCDSPPFAIPVYSIAYVSNLADIKACVPKSANADCNGVAGNTKASSAANVRPGKRFQLLFADDPSYYAANTFGGVTVQIAGTSPACSIDVGPDDAKDVPPGYSDPGAVAGATPSHADFTGVGPYVEFDIDAHAAGTCSVNLIEDTGLKRTFAFQIAVKAGW
jgi:hypothetical protein